MFQRISASILCLDYNNEEVLSKAVSDVEKAGADFIHFDVMDGKFVERKTFDHKLVNFVKERTNLLLDVHLMVQSTMRQPRTPVPFWKKSKARTSFAASP